MKVELLEFVASDNAAKRESGIIRNVVILGSKSRNRRRYSVSAMRQAVPLYEGKAVFIDHPTHEDKERKARSSRDRFGVLENVRFTEGARGPQIRGDLRYLETHPMAARVAEDLGRNLGFFGLSHMGDGEGQTMKDGVTLVESITRIAEVDLVTNPATCLSLVEQAAGDSRGTPATGPAEPSYPMDGSASEKRRFLSRLH